MNVTEGYTYLNEWYEQLGIEPLDWGWDFGWTPSINQERYWQEWIDVKCDVVTLDDDLEIITLEFAQEPVYDFENYI